MMDNNTVPKSETLDLPQTKPQNENKSRRSTTVGLVIGGIVLLGIMVAGFIFLLSPNTTPVTVARIRDIFIILLSLVSFFIGFVLVIFLIQLSRLINLLQNEIKPILDSTNDTINNLRGTTEFVSNNLAEPIIKMNEYLAGIHKLFEIFSFSRKK